ncbi:hypothetical protein SAMN05444156_0703 [Verrucomicrobium sp. GAS474]|uniref:hypothetical protein n=1 Tax=Verrucomicrobium sp. GAS474 TaxID=1882831 RepID=UPI00087CAA94|nr:hypothetical protein [Verrucomicrobium sp. GAS474]SDT91539.1 hypothetical protein SAMN05444156_0703 [Verrucomicrobium sp. GAS474]
MNPTTLLYLIYLAISLLLTVGVAHTLKKNGRVFLVDCFDGREDLADSINQLLVVGFYLINLGFVTFALKTTAEIPDTQQVIEVLSVKVGQVLLVLGAMHFGNFWTLSRMRRKHALAKIPPAPDLG